MGKLFKILGWSIGLIVVLVVAAVVILPQVVDPNDYKEEIVAKVKAQTGRDLVIDGRIDLSVFPWLGVETGSITLGNAKGFEEKAFAAIKSAAVRVKLMPLLSRQLEVDTVELKGLELNLTRLKNGTSNWDDLAGAGKHEQSGAGSGGGSEGTDDGLAGLTIGGIDISDASIVWDDRSSGQRLSIDQFRLNSGPVVSGEPVDLQLGMLLQSKEPAVKANLDLVGVVALDEAAGVVDVSGLKITLDAEGAALPGGAVKAVLEAAISAALSGSQFDVSGLKLNAGELNLSGNLEGRNLSRQPEFSGNLNLAEFNLRQWMGDHGMALPPMADAKTLTRVGASLKLNANDGATRMEDMDVRLDDSRINGNASLRGSAIGFNLNLDAIDADRYLPQDTKAADKPAAEKTAADKPEADKPEAAGTSGNTNKATGEETLLPVETLRKLNIDGTFSIGRLIISKLLAEQLKLTLKAKDGRLKLGQQVNKFYQGGYKGEASVDVRGKTPKTRIDAAATGI
ncbi:MAG: AsmA family protein, partial [Gammaproteobacteria bacterium]|nr:AsmA family protein [Gammaproteobacteria bacterium]